jgi:hypothetical protein
MLVGVPGRTALQRGGLQATPRLPRDYPEATLKPHSGYPLVSQAGTALRPRAAGCEIPGVLQRFICARKPLKEAVQSRACISNPDLPES